MEDFSDELPAPLGGVFALVIENLPNLLKKRKGAPKGILNVNLHWDHSSSLSFSKATSATLFPLKSIPPKVGLILRSPKTAEALDQHRLFALAKLKPVQFTTIPAAL